MDFDTTDPRRTEEFVRLFAEHESRIHAYILTILPNWNDADEVFQETCVVLWRKFDEFELGTDFFRWAARIAHYKVLTFRKQRKRTPLAVSDAFVEAVAAETEARADLLADRQRALADCVAKLKERDRDLLNRRYTPGVTTKTVAKQLGRPVKSIYAALERIRHVLFECIERTLAAEGRA